MMKKLVYFLLSVVVGFGGLSTANGQTFLTASGSSDTASDFIRSGNTDIVVNNPLRSATGGPVYIKTTILSINVPSGSSYAPQFCDNASCTNPSVGTIYRSAGYTGPGLYDVTFPQLGNAAPNTVASVRVLAQDTMSGYSRTLTFLAWKPSLGVTRTLVSSDDVTVYPNPARDAVNVIYDENAGVKKIAIYNLIGKMMQAYIPMDTKSAKLDIDNIPAGVYFIRLMDGQGHVLATRRFTRQ